MAVTKISALTAGTIDPSDLIPIARGSSSNKKLNLTNAITSVAAASNALTATTLQNARTINGVSFDGSANITITAVAGAGALTGATLASGVTASSLLSAGGGTFGALSFITPGSGVSTALAATPNATGGVVVFNGNIGLASGTSLGLTGTLSAGRNARIGQNDLAGGTNLTIGYNYYDTLSAPRTLAFVGALLLDGDKIELDLVVIGGPHVLTFTSSSRFGSTSTTTTVSLPTGNHHLEWVSINSNWKLFDTAIFQLYDADLATWAGVTPGSGIATALAVNTGSAGAPVLFNGALGTPSTGSLTNCTSFPVGGLTGLGTGVGVSLAAAINSVGGIVTYEGVFGALTGTSLALGGATIGSNALAVTGTAAFSSTLTVAGALSATVITSAGRIKAISVKTTTYTLTTSDEVIIGNHATTDFTVTMIAASTNTGRVFEFKNKNAALMTIDFTSLGACYTDSSNNTVVLNNGDSLKVISDGTTWNAI